MKTISFITIALGLTAQTFAAPLVDHNNDIETNTTDILFPRDLPTPQQCNLAFSYQPCERFNPLNDGYLAYGGKDNYGNTYIAPVDDKDSSPAAKCLKAKKGGDQRLWRSVMIRNAGCVKDGGQGRKSVLMLHYNYDCSSKYNQTFELQKNVGQCVELHKPSFSSFQLMYVKA